MRAVFQTAGQQVTRPSSITAIVWTGATTAADRCVIAEIGGEEVWEGRASGTDTYLGIRMPDTGERVQGFEVTVLSSGKVFVYYQ